VMGARDPSLSQLAGAILGAPGQRAGAGSRGSPGV
jgi:hypothetical protein